MPVLQFHPEHGVRERLQDGPVLRDGRLFRHSVQFGFQAVSLI
jgi:hypothetical protein